MTSPKKMAANRANAKKSTGPKSSLGKAHASGNSLKHGFFASAYVLPGEDAAEFQALRDELWAELNPMGSRYQMLFNQLLRVLCQLKRTNRAEVAYYKQLEEEGIDHFPKLLTGEVRHLYQHMLEDGPWTEPLPTPLPDDFKLMQLPDAEGKLANFVIPDGCPPGLPEQLQRAFDRYASLDHRYIKIIIGSAASQPADRIDMRCRALIREAEYLYEVLEDRRDNQKTIEGEVVPIAANDGAQTS